MKRRFRSGGLAAWSIQHPIGISVLAIAAIVLGFISAQRLGVDLLPNIIFPEVRVRVMDPGVPALIMEDQITRQLEEQLAITENAIEVQSRTSEGRSAVDLSFPYGTDIDTALRDASTRLDRARRFLPDTVEAPVIYKRDPSQFPVMELVVSSNQHDPIELRTWTDYTFSKYFINIPGVASVEVGGGLKREITVIADQERLAGIGMDLLTLESIINGENIDAPGGRMYSNRREISARTLGRVTSLEELRSIPLWNTELSQIDQSSHLSDVAEVIDTHEDEAIRVRLNKSPGVKLSIQKQPQANTVEVAEAVIDRFEWLKHNKLIPPDISVTAVGDQSIFIKHALNNAGMAAIIGGLLAMAIIYIFLGNIKRTLIIGTAIPIGILVTFSIMEMAGLTLNIMTLGGMALGTGLLIDSTIVMLENITRHQNDGNSAEEYSITAAAEVNSPIIASTMTNLAAIIPFLFIGGLVGLLFQELIITITSAMLSALIVALTLVPALGSRMGKEKNQRHFIDKPFAALKIFYTNMVKKIIHHPFKTLTGFIIVLVISLFVITQGRFIFIPKMDEGRVGLSIIGDPGMHLDEMDITVQILEDLLLNEPAVKTLFTTSGGFVFGRSEFLNSNRGHIRIQLTPVTQRSQSSEQWIEQIQKKIQALNLTGYKFRLYVRGMTGFHMGSGDDAISMRVQGKDISVLQRLGAVIAEAMHDIEGIKNIEHTYEENTEEFMIKIDRQRAADLGIRVEALGDVLRIALNGKIISEYIDGDRQFDIRLRLPRADSATPEAMENILAGFYQGNPVRLREVASIIQGPAPTRILHDQQQRIVEITASLNEGFDLNETMIKINEKLAGLEIPDGYLLYDGGANKTLKEGRKTGRALLLLAVFLVFVVMAVQYESLRNPFVILLSIPFAAIGVALGMKIFSMPLSMPMFLGFIMLAGIVVNNAIMLVEQIEIEREKNSNIIDAIGVAASLRLRPILMTTLTTVFGMMPLALGLGEGSEMLQPLAFVIVWGLSFSMLVSLVLIPAMYKLLHFR